MEWGRTISKDIVIAHHEAAHAVTAEFFAPGSVVAASIEGDCEGFEGVNTTGHTAIGQVVWRLDLWPSDFELAVAIAASRPGEWLVYEHVDPADTPFKGDDLMLRRLDVKDLTDVRRTAQEVVRGNAERIRHLASVLLEHRVLPGEGVRAHMDAGPIRLESQRTRPLETQREARLASLLCGECPASSVSSERGTGLDQRQPLGGGELVDRKLSEARPYVNPYTIGAGRSMKTLVVFVR